MAHSIGKTIAELRKSMGWTQVELAGKLGVSDKAVSKWESGGGFPEITQLPVLSEIFGVTIDYIMTGKRAGSDIIFMSKSEYCAQTDNAELAEKRSLTTIDENGKSLMDYIAEYDCPRVFAAICNRKDFKYDSEKHDINLLYRYALITNNTGILDRYTFKKHKHVESKGVFNMRDKWYTVTDELLDVIALDARVNEETLAYLLSGNYMESEYQYVAWYATLPYLLHRCYLHGKMDMVDKILSAAEESNGYAYRNLALTEDINIGEHEGCVHVRPGNYGIETLGINILGNEHYFIGVLRKTVELASSRCDYAYFERFEGINGDIRKYCRALYESMKKRGLV